MYIKAYLYRTIHTHTHTHIHLYIIYIQIYVRNVHGWASNFKDVFTWINSSRFQGVFRYLRIELIVKYSGPTFSYSKHRDNKMRDQT